MRQQKQLKLVAARRTHSTKKKKSVCGSKHCDSCILDLPNFILFYHRIHCIRSATLLLLMLLWIWYVARVHSMCLSVAHYPSICCDSPHKAGTILSIFYNTFNVFAHAAFPLRTVRNAFEYFWIVVCSTFWVEIRCGELNSACATKYIPYYWRGIVLTFIPSICTNFSVACDKSIQLQLEKYWKPDGIAYFSISTLW